MKIIITKNQFSELVLNEQLNYTITTTTTTLPILRNLGNPKSIQIPKYIPYDFRKNLGLVPGSVMSYDDFMDNIKVGINAFHIESEGWKFPIYPAFITYKNFRLSGEPVDRENGKFMLRFVKKI
jgi:hypothetical protein